jgi:hypothetical protein
LLLTSNRYFPARLEKGHLSSHEELRTAEPPDLQVSLSSNLQGDLAMPDVMVDRRGTPRYSIILVAEVTEFSSKTRLNARSSDLSRSGCYIDTLNPIPTGTSVLVRLFLGSDTFEAPGKVMYVSNGLGMGIAFNENLAPNQLAILDRWLAEATAQT